MFRVPLVWEIWPSEMPLLELLLPVILRLPLLWVIWPSEMPLLKLLLPVILRLPPFWVIIWLVPLYPFKELLVPVKFMLPLFWINWGLPVLVVLRKPWLELLEPTIFILPLFWVMRNVCWVNAWPRLLAALILTLPLFWVRPPDDRIIPEFWALAVPVKLSELLIVKQEVTISIPSALLLLPVIFMVPLVWLMIPFCKKTPSAKLTATEAELSPMISMLPLFWLMLKDEALKPLLELLVPVIFMLPLFWVMLVLDRLKA